MGDHQDGRPELVRELLDELEDLRLDRHVERGGGLVREDQLRIAGEGDRDHHALAHPARELERVVAQALLGARDADLREQLDDAVAGGGIGEAHVLADGLGDLVADRERRVQAGQRVLEDEPDLLAAQLADAVVVELEDVDPVEGDRAGDDPPGRVRARAGRSRGRSRSCRSPTRRRGRASRRTSCRS